MIRIKALDHVVLNVRDVDASIAFYCDVLGLRHERLDEFRAGAVKFPSVRVTPETIIDLFPPQMYGDTPHGTNVNHIAFDVDGEQETIDALLSEHNIEPFDRASNNFGARGLARSVYIRDPDGNAIELRTYH
jgi:catechol 2,3-dioxygenase-like lactoylglutathione lyase family enzyme